MVFGDHSVQNETPMQVFYEKNFTRKMCARFFPNPEDTQYCKCCNYGEEQHHSYDDIKRWSQHSENWRQEMHLDTVVCKEIKRINFVNQVENFEKLADICIVSNDTHPQTVLNVLFKEWQLERPNLVVSVTGSARSLPMKPAHFKKLKSGFLETITPTKSWLLTGGTSLGVDNLVSEIMKEAQYLEWMGTNAPSFYMVGLSNFNCIERNDEINKAVLEGDTPYCYLVKKIDNQLQFSKEYIAPLNSVHSHFVMIEGGVRGKYGQEIKVRSAVEEYIGKSKSTNKKDGEGIPIVLVVIGGEFGTFERVSNALQKGIPVVICKGTGGAADIIATALFFAKNSSNFTSLSDNQENLLLQAMDKMLDSPKLQGFLFPDEPFVASKHMHFLKEALSLHQMVYVFDLDDQGCPELDSIMIRALIDTSISSGKNPVGLAMLWNRCDSVIQNLLSDEIVKAGNDVHNLANIENFMTNAILEDKLGFVQLFLELGYEMMSFLTRRKLGELYQYTMSSYPPFRTLVFKNVKKNLKNQYFIDDVYKIVYNLTGTKLCAKNDESEKSTFSEPFRELAIWAAFTNRWEISYFFWTHSKQPIMLALILSEIWKANASVLSADELDEEEFMLEHSKEMMEISVEILNSCWDTNKDLTQQLIQHDHAGFGFSNLMRLAGSIEAKDFVAHDCFQVSIDYLWKGGLRSKLIRTFLCLFFPPLISKLKLNESILNDDYDVDWVESENEGDENQSLLQTNRKNEGGVEFKEPKPARGHSFGTKLVFFYNAPLTKFCGHFCAYLAFLFIFTQFYLYHLDKDKSFNWHCLVFLFMLCYALEELRQIVVEDASFKMKIKFWSQSEWNIVDFSYLSLFFTSFFLNFIARDGGDMFGLGIPAFSVSKGLYGVICLLLWVRLLRFYQCSPRLGQIWIMIRKMLIETIVFMSVLGVVVVAAGFSMRVFTQEYMDLSKAKQDAVYESGLQWIILRPFFTFNGELFLDQEKYITSELAKTIYYAIILMFLFFGNALLLNLLIALYGSIYSEISETAEIEWKSEMLSLVQEYEDKTFLPPPFNIFETSYLLLKYFFCKETVKPSINITKNDQMKIFETYCLNEVLMIKKSSTTATEDITKILTDVQKKKKKLDQSTLKINDFCTTLESERKELLKRKNSKN